jgi:DNA polymerase V
MSAWPKPLLSGVSTTHSPSYEFELHSGDRLIVDRSLEPRHRDVVLACIDGEVTVKRLIIKEGKRYLLTPDNKDFPLIELNGNQELIIWGVVTYSIHKAR